MKIGKILGIFFKLLLALVILLGVAYAVLNLAGNLILAKPMEQALGVPVEIGKLRLGLFSSEIGIYDLKIKNPEGFQEKILASIPEIFVQYHLKGFLNGKLHIGQIRVDLDSVSVERNAENKVNLAELTPVKEMAKKPAGGRGGRGREPEEESMAAEKPALKLQIDVVRFNLGRARYIDTSRGEAVVREFPVHIQNALIHDVTEPGEIVRQIVFKILQKIGLNALMPDFGQLSTGFQTQAAIKVEEIKEAVGGWMDKLKDQMSGEGEKEN